MTKVLYSKLRWLVIIFIINLALSPHNELFATPLKSDSDKELISILKQAANNADSFEDKYDAQVWLASKNNPLKRFIKDEQKRMELLTKIHREAKRADLSPEIVLAVIEIESGFDRFAISRVGARGIMQIMPFWKKEIGRDDDNLFNIDTNLRYGCTILKYYLDKEQGRMAEALARYNGSYGTHTYAGKVLDAWSEYWK